MDSLFSLFATGVLLISMTTTTSAQFDYLDGGIIRGPKNEKKIALEFTGGYFAESGNIILDELKKRKAKASFFFIGDFFRIPEFKPLIERIVNEGHYLGPHSDKHPLYCPWEGPKKTLISKDEFMIDIENNLKEIEKFGVKREQIKYFIPPYEWYNREIVDWTSQKGMTLINFTPGTRSNADYTEEEDKRFVSSQVIYDSILKKEQEDPDGLNGFLLLMHVGAGPKRTDKMHTKFPQLLDYLQSKDYQFVRVDELLK